MIPNFLTTLIAMSIFFYFRNSPFPKDQLLLFGNDKLKVLTNSEELLNRMDCNFHDAVAARNQNSSGQKGPH